MSQNRKHELPVNPVKGFLRICSQKYAGSPILTCCMDQVQDFSGVIPSLPCRDETHLIQIHQGLQMLLKAGGQYLGKKTSGLRLGGRLACSFRTAWDPSRL